MAIVPNRVDFTTCEQSTSNRKIIEQKRVVCIVPECNEKSITSKLKFFKLPQDLVRRNIWLTSIKLNSANLKNKYNFFCEKHFAPEHIGYSRLTQNAVPFLNIPSFDVKPSIYEDINVTGKELNLPTKNSCKSIGTQTNNLDEDIDFLNLINPVNCHHCDEEKYNRMECNGCSKKSVKLNLYKKKMIKLQKKIKILTAAKAKCNRNLKNLKVKYINQKCASVDQIIEKIQKKKLASTFKKAKNFKS